LAFQICTAVHFTAWSQQCCLKQEDWTPKCPLGLNKAENNNGTALKGKRQGLNNSSCRVYYQYLQCKDKWKICI
jgi:hypothetical protein